MVRNFAVVTDSLAVVKIRAVKNFNLVPHVLASTESLMVDVALLKFCSKV